MIGARPPEYDEQQWQRLRRDGPAALGGMLGLLAVLAASVAWMLVLIPPGRGQMVRLDPLSWLVVVPGATLIGAGLLSYRPRALRLLRWGLVVAPVAGVGAVFAGPAAAPGGTGMVPVLIGLAAVSILAAGGSATALRFSPLSPRGHKRFWGRAGSDCPPPLVGMGGEGESHPVALDAAGRIAVQLAALVLICGLVGAGFAAISAFGAAGLVGMWVLAVFAIAWMFRLAARVRRSRHALGATLAWVPAALAVVALACLAWLAAAPSPVARLAAIAVLVLTVAAGVAAMFGRQALRRSTGIAP